MKKIITSTVFLAIASLNVCPLFAQEALKDYERKVQEWRKNREEKLKKPYDWPSVVGLFWLNEGDNTFGTSPASDIQLPKGIGLPTIGFFSLNENKVTLKPEMEALVKVNGGLVETEMLVNTDQSERGKDEISVGRLKIELIVRNTGVGEKIGVRVRDPESYARKNFKKLSWFDVDDEFRVNATFATPDVLEEIQYLNILDGTNKTKSYGYVTFILKGQKHKLLALGSPDKPLFLIFTDNTSGKETYGACRYLSSEGPVREDGMVTLDFNKAYNPPCAFTNYATCPLPPKGNDLNIAITAGEKYPGDYSH